MSTFRRDKLLKMAKAGDLVCVGSYHYDEMTGTEQLKETKPVRVKSGYGDFLEGFVNVWESDFSSRSGRAYLGDNRLQVCLHVHGNCNYDLRLCAKGWKTVLKVDDYKMLLVATAGRIYAAAIGQGEFYPDYAVIVLKAKALLSECGIEEPTTPAGPEGPLPF